MPISSQVPIIGYVANGVTKSFAFPFATLSADDLKVKVGADVVTTGFSIAGVGDRDGGSVTFTDAPASLTPIILYREVTLDRTTDYQENGDLLAIVLDDDLDRIWMALQDQLLQADRAVRAPIGETLQQLPPASERALMALAFDADGNPIVVRGTNDGGAALALDLLDTAPGKGAELVGYDDGTVQDVLDDAKPMANYTALRAYTGRATGVRITQTGLAGFFQRDASDTTSADNGGTIIVDAAGRRWKRLHDGHVNVQWFGAKADYNGTTGTDDTAAIQAAIDYAYTKIVPQATFPEYGWQSRGGMTVRLPAGVCLTSSAPITMRPNVSLKGEGKSSSAIYSTYDGVILQVAPATKSGEYNKAGITMADFMIIGNRALTTTQTGIDMLRPVGMKVVGVVINSCSGDGMVLRETSNSTFIDLEIANCGGCGLRLMEGTDGLPCNANTFISPRILYNDGDGIVIADEGNGNTFIGGSVERNGYASAGVGYYNVKITSDSYQPNHFIDLWTEGPCEAHIYMNATAGIGSQLRLTGWKHFGDGAANSPSRALIVDRGFVKIIEPTASAVSYKSIAGSNAPFRLNKTLGAAIIYVEKPSGATVSDPTKWIEDESGNTTGLTGLASVDAIGVRMGPQVFYNEGNAADGFALRNKNQSFAWFQSRASSKDILLGDGTAAPDAGIRRVGAGQIAPRSGDFFNVGGAWNASHLVMGAYRLWVDATGKLRIKNGAPASDTDGTVVGAQT